MATLEIPSLIFTLNLEPTEFSFLCYIIYKTENGEKRFKDKGKDTFTKLKIHRTRFFEAVATLRELGIIETVNVQGNPLEVCLMPVFEWKGLPAREQKKGTRV